MNWQNEWNAISARVTSLVDTGRSFNEEFEFDNRNDNGLITEFSAQMIDVDDTVKIFCERFEDTLPDNIRKILQHYLHKGCLHRFIPHNRKGNRHVGVAACLMAFSLLVGEMKYSLSNTSEVIKRQSERAFLHLQQSIAAADDIQQRWEKAFASGETACEKLGAAHLLQFGIYAFKAHGPGARTDLVFPERPLNIDAVQRTADGLVLTEWKKVNTKNDAATIAEHARQQSALYNSGILGGIELATYRFIVLVSEKQLDDITDEEQDGVIYRHINIAVKPESPSVAALK